MPIILAALAAALIADQDAPPPKPAVDDNAVAAVVVTGDAAPAVRTSIDRRSYSLGQDLQATTGSIADALRNLPGVEVDIQGNLTLRGDSDVTIQIDGKPSPAFQGVGRAEALQQLPADQIERVEVMTTPSAANNPEGSGIINLVMKRSRGAGRTGSVYSTAGTLGLKRIGGTFGYNSKILSVTGTLAANALRNKSYLDSERSPFHPTTGRFERHIADNVGRNLTRGQNGGLNVGYDVTPKDHLSAAATYNQLLIYGYPTNFFEDRDSSGALTGFQDRLNRRRFTEYDTGLSGGWRHSFGGEGHTLSVDLLSNSTRVSDLNLWTVRRSFPAMTPLETNNLFFTDRHSELKVNYVRPNVAGGKLTLGYEQKRDDNDGASEIARGETLSSLTRVRPVSFDLNYRQTIGAAYATYERPIGDLTMLAGLRLEKAKIGLIERAGLGSGEQDYFKAFPSLNLAYRLDDRSKLTFGYSKRVQRPSTFLLTPVRLYIDPKNEQVGNPRLKPQEIQSFEGAYEQRREGAYYLATVYFRQSEGEFSPVVRDLGDGVFLTTFDNVGSSKAAGIELTANGKLATNLTYTANGNLFRTQINASNLGLGGGERSANGVSGRVSLNWQARPNDLFQLNLTAQGKRLLAQGYVQPNTILNLGWRHKINDRVTLTTSVQDLFRSNRFLREYDTPQLRERSETRFASRAILLRLDYRFGVAAGGRPAVDPQFEYGGGGGG